MITAEPMFQHLAEGFPVGMRFHSAPVVRLADAKPVHLGHAARADGAWRLYVFADRNDPTTGSHFRELCEFLESDASPITRFTPAGADPDSVIDVRADLPAGPPRPRRRRDAVGAAARKGRFGLVDYEKMFCPDPKPRTSSTCAGSTATRAASSSSGRTSTSRTCSRCTGTRRWPTSSPAILVDAE